MQSIQSPTGTQITYSSLGRSPFEASAATADKGLKGGPGNFYGAFSIQNFVDQATLSNSSVRRVHRAAAIAICQRFKALPASSMGNR